MQGTLKELQEQKGEKMKMLLDYVVVDAAGYAFAASRCNQWKDSGVNDVSDIINELFASGVTVGRIPRSGLFVLGNMYNPSLGIDGFLWVTGEIVDVLCGEGGEMVVLTLSGSKYRLVRPLAISVASGTPSVRTKEVSVPTPTTDEVFVDPAGFYDILVSAARQS